jgi:hypothetical protein
MSPIERDRVAAALRDEFSAWIAGHPNAGVFDWNVAAENVLRAANPRGTVGERDRLREVLQAVLMEPDPIKRNQLAAPVLANPGGQ